MSHSHIMSLVKILKSCRQGPPPQQCLPMSSHSLSNPKQKSPTQHPLGKSTFDSKTRRSVMIIKVPAAPSAH